MRSDKTRFVVHVRSFHLKYSDQTIGKQSITSGAYMHTPLKDNTILRSSASWGSLMGVFVSARRRLSG